MSVQTIVHPPVDLHDVMVEGFFSLVKESLNEDDALKNKTIIYEQCECKNELNYTITIEDSKDLKKLISTMKYSIEVVGLLMRLYDLNNVNIYCKYLKNGITHKNEYKIIIIAKGIPKDYPASTKYSIDKCKFIGLNLL